MKRHRIEVTRVGRIEFEAITKLEDYTPFCSKLKLKLKFYCLNNIGVLKDHTIEGRGGEGKGKQRILKR